MGYGRFFILVLLFIITSFCFSSCLYRIPEKSDVKVLYGQEIPLTTLPEVVRISFFQKQDSLDLTPRTCTGTIIREKKHSKWTLFVLTAAHCTTDLMKDNQDRPRIWLPAFPSVKIEAIHRHPDYDKEDKLHLRDVALLRFNQHLSSQISLSQKPIETGKKVTIVGFGQIHPELPLGGNKKFKGSNKYLPGHPFEYTNDGENLIRNLIYLFENHGSITASGDSGGPLLSETNTIYGVLVTGNNQTNYPNRNSVYVDVHHPKVRGFLEKYIELP